MRRYAVRTLAISGFSWNSKKLDTKEQPGDAPLRIKAAECVPGLV